MWRKHGRKEGLKKIRGWTILNEMSVVKNVCSLNKFYIYSLIQKHEIGDV